MTVSEYTPELLAVALGSLYGFAVSRDSGSKKWQTVTAGVMVGTGFLGHMAGFSPKITLTLAECGIVGLSQELSEKLQGDTQAIL